jgi:hypothetical protein
MSLSRKPASVEGPAVGEPGGAEGGAGADADGSRDAVGLASIVGKLVAAGDGGAGLPTGCWLLADVQAAAMMTTNAVVAICRGEACMVVLLRAA